MSFLPLSFLVGVLTGFLGAIPPGPLNVTIIRKASHGHLREAYRVAAGGSFIDFAICSGIGLGFSWMLERVFQLRWLKVTLALFLLVYGFKIALDGRREAVRVAKDVVGGPDDEPAAAPVAPPKTKRMRLPMLVGALQGAANPALFVNWTLIIGFLLGHKLLHAGAVPAIAFALGIGTGVFLWFALVIEILKRLKDHPIAGWLQRSTSLAGALLVLFGLFFTLKTFGLFGDPD